MNVLDAIYERRSIRAYHSEQISPSQLNSIVSAGLWSPSARNEQEILFVVLQNEKILTELKEDFAGVNFGGDSFKDFSFNAPTLILLYGDKDFPFTDIDAGIAVQNMALAAHSLGLGSLIIGCIRGLLTDKHDEWCDKLNIPKNNKFTIALAVGHTAKPTPKRDRKDDRVFKFD